MPTVQFYLAFANQAARPLPELTREARELRAIINAAAARGLCSPLMDRHVREFCTVADLFDMFAGRPDGEVGILHFAGHGSPDFLEFSSTAAGGAAGAAHAEPLASFLARQRLQLVFLNACSTCAQAQHLLAAHPAGEPGVRAVIVTSREIQDALAVDFASRFYKSLAAGRDLDTAFHDARDELRSRHGDRPEALFRHLTTGAGPSAAQRELPWELLKRPSGPGTGTWNLLSATRNYRAVLPPLPPGPLPPLAPFVGLRPYRATEAAVFFGRDRDVWDLYRFATQRPFEPVLLVYGRSGTGKSSVLEAGLVPRLRVAGGRDDRRDGGPAEVFVRRLGAQDTPLTVLRDLLKAEGAAPLGEAWRAAEGRLGRPLFVVLDQFEEVFLRAGEGPAPDWQALVAALPGLPGSAAGGPAGKLVLSFREEHYGRVSQDLAAAGLVFADRRLEPLDPPGVVEAVAGPARLTEVRDRYGLEVEAGLAERVAADLTADRQSPVAPTLQLLLTRMYEDARAAAPSAPRLTGALYDRYRQGGLHLDRFLDDQLQALREPPEGWPGAGTEPGRKRWAEAVVDSGLLLSVLGEFLTRDDTAAERSEADLLQAYRHRAEFLPAILRRCQAVYLLGDGTAAGHYRLGHDTLAPRLRRRIESSQQPGPRAARILAAQFAEYQKDREHVGLGERDLALVRVGAAGMAALTAEQEAFCRACEAHHARRRRVETVLRRVAAAVGLVAVVLGILATLQWRKAVEALRQNDLAVASDFFNSAALLRASPGGQVHAAHALARARYHFARAGDPARALNCLVAVNDVCLRRAVVEAVPLDGMTEPFAWSRDGSRILGAADGSVGLWDAATGDRLAVFRHDTWTGGAALSPDETRVLCWGGDRVAVWQVDSGQEVGRHEHSGRAIHAVFSPDGSRVLSSGWDGRAVVWTAEGGQVLGLHQHGKAAVHAVFSRDGARVLSWGDDGRAVVWQAGDGRELGRQQHAANVAGAAFSGDGTRVLSWGRDSPAQVWLAEGGQVLGSHAHAGAARWAAFSKDAARVLSWGDDSRVVVWRADNGKEAAAHGHEGGISGAAFSPDGGRVLSWGADGRAVVWRAADGQPVTVRQHQGSVSGAAFSPDGSRVVSWALDGRAVVWQTEGGQERGAWSHPGGVLDAAFSGDGSRVLSWAGGRAVVWRADGGQELAGHEHRGQVYGARPSPDGTRVVSWGEDGRAVVWHADGRQPRDALEFHKEADGVVVSPDGNRVLSWGADGRAAAWSVDSRQELAACPHAGAISGAAFSPDGGRLVSWGADGRAVVWQAGDGRELGSRPHASAVQGAVLNADGTRVLSWDDDGRVVVWTANDGRERATLQHPDGALGGAFSADGARVLTWGKDGRAVVWTAEGGRTLAEHQHAIWARFAAFSPDGSRVVSVGSDGHVVVWAADSGREVAAFTHTGDGWGAQFSPDGSRVLSWAEDGRAVVWSVRDGKVLGAHQHRKGSLGAVFSRDGALVFSWGGNRAVVWQADNGKELGAHEHPDGVSGAALSADGARVLSAGWDGRVVVWQTDGGKELASWSHQGGVDRAAFSADGLRVFSWGEDRRAAVWPLTGFVPATARVPDLPADDATILFLEARTATRLGPHGRPEPLTHQEWRDKTAKLRGLAGSP